MGLFTPPYSAPEDVYSRILSPAELVATAPEPAAVAVSDAISPAAVAVSDAVVIPEPSAVAVSDAVHEVVAAPVVPVVEAPAATAVTEPATTPAELSAVLHSQELARAASLAAQPATYSATETTGVLIPATSHASAREGFAALVARAKNTADADLHVMLSMVGTLLHLHSFASHQAAMTGTYKPQDAN